MIRRLLPTIIAVAALTSAAYALTLLDRIVYETLYSYGLQFSYDWANPYWALLRVTLALLAVCAVVVAVNAILIVRSGPRERQLGKKIAAAQKVVKNIPVATQPKENAPPASVATSPQPVAKPPPRPASITPHAPSYASPEATPLFKCTHCGKTFTQPLRMLDFQVDPPRIINVCPFCNETLPSGRTVEESRQTENRSFFRKNNDHTQKPLTR